MEKPKKDPVGRRTFLKAAALGTAALVTEATSAKAQQAEPVRGGAAVHLPERLLLKPRSCRSQWTC